MKLFDILPIFDTMALNFYWKDIQGVFLGCNLNQAQWYGKQSAEEVIGKTDLELMGDSACTRSWMENDQKVIQTNSPHLFEEKAFVNGVEITALSYKSPLRDSDGKIIGIIGISIDITAQKNIERTLLKEKHEIELTLDNIITHLPGHIYWMDKDNKFLGCNDLQAKHAGLNNRHEIVGKTNHEMPWAETAADLNRINDEVRLHKRERIAEEFAKILDGNERIFLSRKMPLLNQNNEAIGVLGVSMDITDRKIMEQKLIEANIAAEAGNRAKNEFLANMSHDVNSPLSGVIFAAQEIANDEANTKETRELAALIMVSTQKVSKLLTSCLELSKIEMEGWSTKTEVMSLSDLLKDIEGIFKPKALSKKLTLHIEQSHDIPDTLIGHKDSLYRVLLNLTGNAIKFTETGGVTLRALLGQAIDTETVNVVFEVQDTGMGIPEDKHNIIFEKLSRLSSAYSQNIEGSGMGLYIVSQYVTRMNGTIRVESEMGKGSTFIVTTPLKVH